MKNASMVSRMFDKIMGRQDKLEKKMDEMKAVIDEWYKEVTAKDEQRHL